MSQENESVNTPEEPEVKPGFSHIPPLGTPHNPTPDPEFTVPPVVEDGEVKE